jgi:hypothetical protein
MSVKVTVKWNKEKFENVEINLGLPVRPHALPRADCVDRRPRARRPARQSSRRRIKPNSQVAVFKAQLFSLTGVPTERQKVMGVKGAAPLYSSAVRRSRWKRSSRWRS